MTIIIPEGATQAEISEQLVGANLISSPFLLKIYAKLRGADTQFQSGTFDIVRGSSMRRIVNQLIESRADETSVTIIEGWTVPEIADYLAGTTDIMAEAYVAATRSVAWQEEFAFLNVKPASRDLEGFLFPDTYRILKQASAEDITRKQLATFEIKVGDISYDDLILASIVEREVRGLRDRRTVADLFKRRLEAGVGLQADSTVNYVTGKNTPAISIEDTKIDSPYNTYKYRGLPPGPISNPGLESVNAVHNPLANDHWFFLTDREGDVHYAKTLEEHNVNKLRYLR